MDDVFKIILFGFLIMLSFKAQAWLQSKYDIKLYAKKTEITVEIPKRFSDKLPKENAKLKKYIKRNLVLFNHRSQLSLKEIIETEVDKEKTVSYKLLYPKAKWNEFKIKNSMLFNYDAMHINYNTLTYKANIKSFETKKKKAVFKMETKAKQGARGFRGGRRIWRFAVLLLIPLFAFIVKQFRKK